MANQIGTFFESKPHDEGVHGVAEHINKFWEPRMRRHFFEVVDGGGEGLKPIVIEAAAKIRRPDSRCEPRRPRSRRRAERLSLRGRARKRSGGSRRARSTCGPIRPRISGR